MTIELGNRLASLRKEKGFSQEEIAEKLGVSRQAVSKWENGEASPDTTNLIALADLYGISLDELVGKKTAPKEEVVEGEVVDEAPRGFDDDDDDDDDDEEDEKGGRKLPSKAIMVNTIISSVGFLVALVAYLILGFTFPGPTGGLGWAFGWVLLLVPIVLTSLIRAIATRHASHFAIAVLIVGVYCGMGIIGNAYGMNLWHPYWALFFLVPIYHIIAGLIDGRNLHK